MVRQHLSTNCRDHCHGWIRDMPKAAAAPFEPKQTAGMPRPVILVIDDDQPVRQSIEIVLQMYDFDVLTARDGEEGLRAYREHRPAAVITDIMMPGRDGIETIREIRREFPDAKIIAMSGGGRIGNTDFVALAMKLGADCGIHKPFDIEKPVELLRTLLAGQRQGPAAA
jgi:DNA-binding response OmpR family regulator